MPAPQTIPIELTQAETDIVWDFVQAEYPGLTGAQVIEKLSRVGKVAIRNYVRDAMTRKRNEELMAVEVDMSSAFSDLKDPDLDPL